MEKKLNDEKIVIHEHSHNPRHSFINIKLWSLVGLTLLVIAIPFTLTSLRNDQDIRQSAQTPPLSSPLTATNGLLGTYFDNKNFTGKSIQRLDPIINFQWWFGPPISGIHEDTFSVRWTGQIQPQYSEDYLFHLTADDGVRLWVNNKLIIDRWTDVWSAKESTSSAILLQAGQRYDIKLEYYENYWAEDVELRWSSPSTPKQIIPQTALFTSTLPSSNLSGNESACVIKEAKMLDGGSPDFSPAGDMIVYNKWDQSNIYQLYTSKVDGTDAKCISCTKKPGGPLPQRHKGVGPMWHPGGQFILTSAEMDNHPAVAISRGQFLSDLYVNGLWSNLYAVTPDGEKWYKLTDYSNTSTDGAMHINVSQDGKKVTWSRMVKEATNTEPFGTWKLMIADFVIDANGTPSLQNIQDVTPPKGIFLEAHGFSPDTSKLIFTGDMENTHTWGSDIYSMDLATKVVTNLTKSPHWDEHAQFSPSGKKIVYMSSEVFLWSFLQTELMLINPDGSGKKQLTRFNFPGYLETTKEKSMPTRGNWNHDGTKMAVHQVLSDRYPTYQMWILTFAGKCGD